MKQIRYIFIACMASMLFSCSSDYLDTTPTASVSPSVIFETTDNAKLAINGICKMMTTQYLESQGFNGEGTIKTYYGNYPGNDYQRCQLTGWAPLMNSTYHERSTSIYCYYPWYYYYKIIGNANTVIANIDAAEGSDADKAFIKAQALTFRAYSFLMLSQIYSHRWKDSNEGASRGIVLRTDVSTDSMSYSTLGETYAQIYADLDEAIADFTASGEDRDADDNYSPNLNVAYAVYARAALTREDWSNAAKYAQMAREGYPLMSASEYKDGGFNTPNDEWIWSVYSSSEETLYYYQYFAYEGSNSSASIARNYPAAISKELYDVIPETDIRKDMFLDPKEYAYNTSTSVAGTDLNTYAKSKYGDKLYSTSIVCAYMQFKTQNTDQPGVGQLNLFRSSEMYLIQAEADCHLGKDAEAQQLLQTLTRDSGRDEAYTCTKTGDELLEEVRLYRRIELWGEGFDWFDYKRWGITMVRHSAEDGGSFNINFVISQAPEDNNYWTWVIPNKEIDYNAAISSTVE